MQKLSTSILDSIIANGATLSAKCPHHIVSVCICNDIYNSYYLFFYFFSLSRLLVTTTSTEEQA